MQKKNGIKTGQKLFLGGMAPKNVAGGWIIGIDEVGRGPLAGPVTVCAVLVPKKMRFFIDMRSKLKDSKKLSEKQRKKWNKWANEKQKIGELFHELESVSPQVIDRINISRASCVAATRAVQKLYRKLKLKGCPVRIYLDGGLFIDGNVLRELDISARHARTIIKGDEKIPAISIASVVAKVARDAYMVKLDKQYPQYGFSMHKGYGTDRHRRAIRRHGPSKVHRLTFLKNFYTIKR